MLAAPVIAKLTKTAQIGSVKFSARSMFTALGRAYDYLSSGPARFFACVFVLIGSPAFYLCDRHMCMAGHMHHPPYSFWDYAGDAWWVLCFPLAALCAVFSPERRYYVLTFLIVASVATRFDGSGLSLFLLVPLDLIALLGLFHAMRD